MLRLEYWRIDPEGMRAVMQVAAHLAKSRIDHALLDMVYLRVSQMNGCSYCVDLHARDAVAHGLDQRLVNDVAAWEDVPFFDERQRAALAWSEAVTDIVGARAPEDAYRAGRARVLEGFLARGHIYRLAEVRARFEAAARRNLARALEALRG